MPGQGVIVGVGAIDYPAEWQAADPRVLAELGVSKVVTVTSTYDHRIIQGAESGLFLQRVHRLLTGEDSFYERVFKAMGVPYEPVRYHRDINDIAEGSTVHAQKQIEVDNLINLYRVRGHLIAHLDPLDWSEPHMHPELDPATLRADASGTWSGSSSPTAWPGPSACGSATSWACCATPTAARSASSTCTSRSPGRSAGSRSTSRGCPPSSAPDEHRWILDRLNAAEALEQFLNTKYIGQKRFGLEGGEAAIPLIDAVLDDAAVAGQAQAVHRHGPPGPAQRADQHRRARATASCSRSSRATSIPGRCRAPATSSTTRVSGGSSPVDPGGTIDVVLASNPSHLEAVDPVVEGMARALQDQLEKEEGVSGHPVLPLLIHGDAAFAGQGVVAETLNMSALPGYETGGTVHLVINNQLGFTTNPASARSSIYATDVAKMVQAPIFHVNGDDPEACVRVGRLAFAFRQAFHKDVVIDLVCYRRYGHNEQDDPSLTQPLLYQLIKEHRSVRKLYTETLVRRGDITIAEAEEVAARLLAAACRPPSTRPGPRRPRRRPCCPRRRRRRRCCRRSRPGSRPPMLQQVVDALGTFPEGFTVHPKLVRVFENRAKLWAGGEADWALGEALAYGTLLLEGRDVRLAGQDTRRGTFGHRNAAVVDYLTGAEYVPLAALGPGRFSIYDSLLSEYAALGFEYGYSLVDRDGLVAWEAQFGDFVNGAQIIIDQFLAAAEIKWGQTSGLTLLLPHGYEGQGAEHSSARMERFLDLCAEDNMQVADVTTAAQLFHLLRRQVLRSTRKPLVLFTPKRYLRAREAYSPAAEFASGHFREVLDDPDVADRDAVRRVVLATGKVALDALAARAKAGRDDVGVVRIEQLLPVAGRPDRRRPWPTTRGPRRWSGCRRNRRTWAPGTSSGTASTTCSGPTSGSTGSPGWRPVRRRPAATPCTSWSRPTCWPAPWVSRPSALDGRPCGSGSRPAARSERRPGRRDAREPATGPPRAADLGAEAPSLGAPRAA